MYSNKNFSGEAPATLQDIMYISNQHVRTVIINGEPWFVAKDVCDILDIKNPSDTLRKNLSDWEKGVDTIYTLGGPQQMGIVNESGLYHLIFISRKPEAEAFRRWVTQDLLPTLRKTGRYEIGTPRRKRLLPRDRKDVPEGFFAEVKKYILPKDEREVAQRRGCTLKHVQKVLAGTTPSYPIMEILVGIAADNRTKGILRPVMHRYTQLVLQFTEVEPNRKED
jgi:prophage antirepressor-like protein